MKKVLGIIMTVFFLAALLTSCGSRRGDKACPNNFSLAVDAIGVSI